MQVKLLGALDYKKVEKVLSENVPDEKQRKKLLEELKKNRNCQKGRNSSNRRAFVPSSRNHLRYSWLIRGENL